MNIYFFFLLLLSFSPAIFFSIPLFFSVAVSLSLSNFSLESFKEKPFEKIGEPRSKKKRKKSLSSMFAFGVMRFPCVGHFFFFLLLRIEAGSTISLDLIGLTKQQHLPLVLVLLRNISTGHS